MAVETRRINVYMYTFFTNHKLPFINSLSVEVGPMLAHLATPKKIGKMEKESSYDCKDGFIKSMRKYGSWDPQNKRVHIFHQSQITILFVLSRSRSNASTFTPKKKQHKQ